MVKVVGVRFKKAGKIYYFDPVEIEISLNDEVLVETARGLEYGIVVISPRYMEESEMIAALKPVIRLANEEDRQKHIENKKMAKEAMQTCNEKIVEHGLEMKVIDTEYTFDNNKLIFNFTAEGRIDFRDLVKDLAAIFKTRIELRQIGVRDEAKMLGGLGPCGRVCCCNGFLGDFEPVSIKMAKEQNLSLNPCKISGICGRLMCCLKYEQDTYEEILSYMPKVGSWVITPDGKGRIEKTNTLLEKVLVRVKLEEDDTEDLVYYNLSEIKLVDEK